jgi:uncharacterized FlaG/YvyC family protein
MEISSITPSPYTLPPASTAVAEAAQRRELVQAARTVNDSGMLGQNQLVFLIDRSTHRAIIRVEDRETHEVVLQVPPEYVLRLAQDLHSGSAQTTAPAADK